VSDQTTTIPKMKNLEVTPDQLIIPKVSKDDRTYKKEFVSNGLALSIEANGLIHRPTVYPSPDEEGKYVVVAGRNRCHAMGKVLKWEKIPVQSFLKKPTDDEIQAITDSENLFRDNLNAAQEKKALARFWAFYIAKYPSKAGRGANLNKAVSEVEAHAPSFVQAVADAHGVSPSTAARLAVQAKNLSPEQIDVLERAKATEGTHIAIARLDDKDAIAVAVNLIGAGAEHEDAIKTAKKKLAEKQAAQQAEAAKKSEEKAKEHKEKRKPGPAPKVKIAAGTAAKPPSDDDLSDRDWADKHCQTILGQLTGSKDPFYRDAGLYRATMKARATFRNGVSDELRSRKAPKNQADPLAYTVMMRVAYMNHPRDWTPCPGCQGSGVKRGSTDRCPSCLGGGYKYGSDKTLA
jgi:septum formation inhibitor MinC